jgi:phenylalanyl-tRNA synthetase alpha chain
VTREEIAELRAKFDAEAAEAADAEALEALRVRYLGRKGVVRAAMKGLGSLSAEERPAVGALLNDLRDHVARALDERTSALEAGEPAAAEEGPAIDVTLPGRRPAWGRRHVIQGMIGEITSIFARMGFAVATGPEVESPFHNFDALNIPPEHPAREPSDNFYVSDKLLVRSQTSTVQIRVMEKVRPPVRIVAPGRVYRPDTVDATHSFMFHQIEGLAVDTDITFADLKAVIELFAREFFPEAITIRLRPSYFPFTEPSAEVDVSCAMCGGSGCAVCKGEGWIELMGCGMVDPNVFDAVGYDPEKYTGFAFGMGVERALMQKYGIDDIRLFYENDVRFLRQF